VKVDRRYWKLTPKARAVVAEGSRGQAFEQKTEGYDRAELKSGDTLKSGDLAEVELIIDSKNEYEYLVFEDMKPAGLEATEVRSGWVYEGLEAYQELRDEKTAFFVRSLPVGRSTLRYKLRAEVPGQFSALPARASAMYAPELRGNSAEMKLEVAD
jgi:uncharacterized protein YfaS (alpha-2-macroglobulin family)